MHRDEAIRLLTQHRPHLADRFGIRTLAFFGSVARNEAGPESDVDILVDFERPVGLFEFLELKDELEKLLARRVDLVTTSALKRQLSDRILSEAVHAA